MAGQVPNVTQELSGTQRQLSPDELQLVGAETETLTRPPMPLIDIAEPEQKLPPVPGSPFGPDTGIAGLPAPGQPGGAPFLFPIVRLTRYLAGDQEFVPLVSWDIPAGYWGDLKGISLKSSNDAITRYRLVIAGADMQLPLDRPTSTPFNLDWNSNAIPGPASIDIEVLSTTGVIITVDALITGVLKTQPT